MRFTVRKVATKWMVWDTVVRAVAIVDSLPSIGLSEETAKQFADMLNSQNQLGLLKDDNEAFGKR
jgi:hypothetical protein